MIYMIYIYIYIYIFMNQVYMNTVYFFVSFYIHVYSWEFKVPPQSYPFPRNKALLNLLRSY